MEHQIALKRIWQEVIEPFHLSPFLDEVGRDPMALHSLIKRCYQTYDLCQGRDLASKWRDFCEESLLSQHKLKRGAKSALMQLYKDADGERLCHEILVIHEHFMASVLGRKILLLIPLDLASDPESNLEQMRLFLEAHGLSLEQVAITAFPQFGRVPLIIRIYDKKLEETNIIEKALLQQTFEVLQGKVKAFDVPRL